MLSRRGLAYSEHQRFPTALLTFLNLLEIAVPPDGDRARFVRFNHLDNDLAPKDTNAKVAQEAETQRLMAKLGIADLGLVREFDLCRFTHGYTRVSL